MKRLLGTLLLLTLAGCLLTGCSQIQDDKGKLDLDAVQRLAEIAQASGATVEMDVLTRPATVGMLNAAYVDIGIELTARFRWQGDADVKRDDE